MTGEQIYWVDPQGGCLKIHDSTEGTNSETQNYFVLGGVEGRWMPDFSIPTDTVYTYDGEVQRGVQTKARKIVLPLMVKGATSQEFLENLRLLVYAMSPKRGTSTLKVSTADNPAKIRMLDVVLSEFPLKEDYDTGMFNAAAEGDVQPTQWRMFPVTLLAPRPFWYDPIEKETTVSGTTTTLLHPFVLDNEGDIEAWPIWTFVEPMTAVTLTNWETRKFMTITSTMAYSDRLYIDTRPLNRNIMLNHITSKPTWLSFGSGPFPLVPGPNKISAVFTGASNTLRCRWVENYLSV